MNAISYPDAVWLWLHGREVDKQAVLLGLRAIWWARIGKLLAFVGGGTIVLDIVGPDQLARWSKSHYVNSMRVEGAVRGVLTGVSLLVVAFIIRGLFGSLDAYDLAVALVIVAVIVGYVVVRAPTGRAAKRLARTVDETQFPRAVRITGLLLLVVGFHFDFLMS